MDSLPLLLLLSFLCHGLVDRNSIVVEGGHVRRQLYESLEATNVDKLLRTGYHFQPPKHWINDPNGPMYYKGYYHLFYQYNPKGAVWGNIVWAHSISKDLINWHHLPHAIHPSHPFDINGCWSGSATVLRDGRPVILYTGIDENNNQVQNIAVPKNLSDPLLINWHKPNYNPVIPPTSMINASAFRDPSTAWQAPDGLWRVTVGSAWYDQGLSLLFKSRDLKKWRRSRHPLHSAKGTGMWECPDFFPVAIDGHDGVETSVVGKQYKHVLKVSLDLTRYEYYTIGKYHPREDRYVPDGTSPDDATGLRYDYGNFYASKTFYDPAKKRRVLWGWSNESDSRDDDIAKGWAGIQTIPRAVSLHSSGKQLVQWPIEEVESLRTKHVTVRGVELFSGGLFRVRGLDASQVDVEVSFHVRRLANAEPWDPTWTASDPQKLCEMRGADARGGVGPFGLLVLSSKYLNEVTAVFFRIFLDRGGKFRVLMCHDPSRSTARKEVYKPSFGGFVDIDIAKHKKISLRTLIDNSVVESFGDYGKTCITSRVYPLVAVGKDAHLFAFNNGTSDIEIAELRAWEMKRPMFD